MENVPEKTKFPTIEFEVYGEYALFSDPITRVGGEKCTYQIPTYEALKGVAMSIYWKPTFTWFVDAVRVMNPIRTERKGIRGRLYKSCTGTEPILPNLKFYWPKKNCWTESSHCWASPKNR